jgi:hypothetical protein
MSEQTLEQKVDKLTDAVGTLMTVFGRYDERLRKLIEQNEREKAVDSTLQTNKLASLTKMVENLMSKMEESLEQNEEKIEHLDAMNSRVGKIICEMGDVLAVYRSTSDDFGENMDAIIEVMKQRDVLMREDIQWLDKRMADTESHFWKRDDKWRSLSSDLIRVMTPIDHASYAKRDADTLDIGKRSTSKKRKKNNVDL